MGELVNYRSRRNLLIVRIRRAAVPILAVSCAVLAVSCERSAPVDPTGGEALVKDSHEAQRPLTVASRDGSNQGAGKSMSDGKRDRLCVSRGQYSLLIVTEISDMERIYNDDSMTQVLSPSPVGGTLVVYVNESPLRLHSRGSGVFSIDDMVEPGGNTVRIEGKHGNKMFIKVLLMDLRRFRPDPVTGAFIVGKVLAKAWLDPSKNPVTLAFNADVPKRPDWEELPGWPKDEERLWRELTDQLKSWSSCCTSHDLDGLLRSWIPDLRNAPLYLATRKVAMETSEAGKNPVSDPRYRLITDIHDVKALFGKRTVILVTGRDESGLPYLFRFSNDDTHETCSLGAITLGRLEGHWVVQHIMR